jgi:predicted signal transduction protein with EAL and GGDEF domain
MVQLGQTLGLAVVAEGIETCSQLDGLRSQRCDYGQGFIFARPQAPDALESLLAQGIAAGGPPLARADLEHRDAVTVDEELKLASALLSDV